MCRTGELVRADPGWVTTNIWGNAHQILDKAPASAFAKHPAGDGYVPVPGTSSLVWREVAATDMSPWSRQLRPDA